MVVTAAAADGDAIRVRDLSKSFGGATALDRASLSVERGGILAVIGPDGAGKTTLLRLLCGILTADSGDVFALGVDMTRDPEAGKARLGYMPQRFSLYGDLSGRENMRFFGDLYEVAAGLFDQRARRMLADFRLADFMDAPSRTLSGGMKQKLALACTLVHEPELLVLDEPTAGVDPVSRRQFWRLLYGLNARGITIVVSTPYMDEAQHASRVALMYRGSVVVVDTPARLKAAVAGRVVEIAGEPATAMREALREHPGLLGLELFGETLHALVPDAAAVIPGLLAALRAAGFSNAALRTVDASFEDAFVWHLRDAGAQA